MFDGLIKIALAEAEARASDDERAVVILDDALATSERIGHRAFDAEVNDHRLKAVASGYGLKPDSVGPRGPTHALVKRL
jgi:hypothetical protein